MKKETTNILNYNYKELDKLTGGLHPGELILIAARPGIGKTSFICNIIRHLTKQNHAIQYLNTRPFHDPRFEEHTLRLLKRIASVQLSDGIEPFEWVDIGKTCEQLSSSNFCYNHISLPAALSKRKEKTHELDIENFFKNIVHLSKHSDVLIIDRVHLENYKSRLHFIKKGRDELFKCLKKVAAELSIPVIVIADCPKICNVRFKKGRDPRPLLDDFSITSFRESDFDTILFLHRDIYYYGVMPQQEDVMEVIVAKSIGENNKVCKLRYVFGTGLLTE